jgi:hypothetical protein
MDVVNCINVDQNTEQWHAAAKIMNLQVPQSEGNPFTT